MMLKQLFVLFSFLINVFFGLAFDASTLVKTPMGNCFISKLRPGDEIFSCSSDDGCVVDWITHVSCKGSTDGIKVLLGSEILIVSENQKFYLPQLDRWVRAVDLKPGNVLLDIQGDFVPVLGVSALKEKIDIYDISVKNNHNFFVTEEGVLVHNAIPVAVGLSWAFGSKAIEFVGGSLIVGGLGCLFGRKKRKGRYKPIIDVDQIIKLNDTGSDKKKVDDAKKKKPKQDTDKSSSDAGKTVEDILKDTKPGKKTNGRSTQVEKPGGYEDAVNDFDSLKPKNVKDIVGANTGKAGKLPDGRDVNVRVGSLDSRPTLEVINGKRRLKVRYGNK